MQVVYFDEVKYEKNRSPFYWLGAIVADAEQIQDLERQVNDLAEGSSARGPYAKLRLAWTARATVRRRHIGKNDAENRR